MSETFHFYIYRNFRGHNAFGKCRGRPNYKSVNGQTTNRVIYDEEITEEQFNTADLHDLYVQSKYKKDKIAQVEL